LSIPGKLVDINDWRRIVVATAKAIGFKVRDVGYNVFVETITDKPIEMREWRIVAIIAAISMGFSVKGDDEDVIIETVYGDEACRMIFDKEKKSFNMCFNDEVK
jgi:hypothetical protein